MTSLLRHLISGKQERERPKGMEFKHFKLIPVEDGEIARWFSEVAALEEDLSLVSSTQAR